jgi:hypothetical protein
MRPAPEICEKCHNPEKFSDDKLVEIKHFGSDVDNTPTSIYLILKTGGGSQRQGLGRGIHWHIENKVLYYATDSHDQTIPYVRVYQPDGTVDEYKDITAQLPATIEDKDLKQMDCITCHNRITHKVEMPEVAMDQAMENGIIRSDIPEIHAQGVKALRGAYATDQEALTAIAALEDYYRTTYPDFYNANQAIVQSAIGNIQAIYSNSVYIEQKSDWDSHANNVGHKDFPGCFRCHDGKHLNAQQESVRLECNLCHSVPVVAGAEEFRPTSRSAAARSRRAT